MEDRLGQLTTHVLDTAHGHPGRNIRIELFDLRNGRAKLLEVRTNDDGRCDGPILSGDTFKAGQYELVFHAGDYFAEMGVDVSSPRFLDQIPIRFGIAAPDEHYHVPLLVSPYSYSTYRGS